MPSTKRKRTAKAVELIDHSEDEESKKRGRPRVERSDESAADRRRTQIRMAQRAYRQRKESTMEELRKQVSELTSRLTMMNKAFGECKERLTHSGLRSDQSRIIAEASEQFESIENSSERHDEGSPPGLTFSSHGSPSESQHSVELVRVPTGPKHVPSWIDHSALGYQPTQPHAREIGMGYIDVQDSSNALLSALELSTPSQHTAAYLDIDERFLLPPSLPVLRTYSAKEATFGRYLHRAAIEKGYQLLLEPDRWPMSYQRVFKLSLLNQDHDKLIAGMRQALARPSIGDIDMSGLPSIHVGGAGTHYPRRDAFGMIRPRKKLLNLGVVSPEALAMLDNAARSGLSVDATVEVAGYEGEWFDPYDVEGYLAEKGISLDPASPFAVVELPAGAESSSLVPAMKLDREQEEHLNADDMNPGDYYGMSIEELDGNGMAWLDDFSRSPSPFSSGQHRATSTMDILGANTPGLQGRKVTRTMIVDVAKFVRALIVSGLCIGQTPGFRRHEVDRALRLAAFEPYPSVLSV